MKAPGVGYSTREMREHLRKALVIGERVSDASAEDPVVHMRAESIVTSCHILLRNVEELRLAIAQRALTEGYQNSVRSK